MTEKIKEQILQVRESGLTNMFDLTMVQLIAEVLELYDLAAYLEEGDTKEYVAFIFTGRY